MKRLKKLLSVLLFFALLIGMIPTSAFADENKETIIEDGVTYKDNGDGTATFNVYQTPVSQSRAGSTVDTRLKVSGDSYVNSDANVDIELAGTYNAGDSIATLGIGGSEIQFVPQPAPAKTNEKASEEMPAPKFPMMYQGMNGGVLQENRSNGIYVSDSVDSVAESRRDGSVDSVAYPGAFNSATDIIFEPQQNSLKESLILSEYSTSEYSYILRLDSLTPEKDGKLIFLRDDTDSIVAMMPAPYMFDAAGRYNYDIDVELIETDGHNYRLIYRLDEQWLRDAAYPVTVDPTVHFDYNYHNYKFIENAFVAESFPDQPAKYYAWSEQELTVGAYKGGDSRAYIRMVFPDDVINEMQNGVLLDLTLHLYVRYGSGTFTAHQVIGGDWSAGSITWNTAPAFSSEVLSQNSPDYAYGGSGGWTTWDLTKAGSAWFNALDQKGAYGICIKSSTGTGMCIASSKHDIDIYGLPAYYSITYVKSPQEPNLTLSAHGNGRNSETGYVDLSWTKDPEVPAYYVGVFNGKEYDYFYVGDTDSWSTRGKNIWPTAEEIAGGRYRLHTDGKGTELPAIPTAAYAKAGGGYGNDNRYYFRVIPANTYKQAPNPSNYAVKNIIMPDTVPPCQAKTLTANPSGWTNKLSSVITWGGISDYNGTSTTPVTDFGSGCVEYAVDGTFGWTNTGSNKGSGSFTLDTSALSDGKHTVYLRATDNAGNIGAYKTVELYIDRTAPSKPAVSILPESWTDKSSVELSWSGISELNDLSRVEYSIDGGEYVSTGHSEKALAAYTVDISALTSGRHSLALRAVDIVGNTGDAETVYILKDILAPTVENAYAEPEEWTNENNFAYFWEKLLDEHSGVSEVFYTIDGGAKSVVESAASDGSVAPDIASLSDGEHSFEISFRDAVGNTLKKSAVIRKDFSDPVTEISSPADGAMLNGSIAVWGTADDISMKTWKLTASTASGDEEIASGSGSVCGGLLGVINAKDYEDGEEISFVLTAEDKAGNTSRSESSTIVINKSAVPVSGSISITAPTNGQALDTAVFQGSYSIDYGGSEAGGCLYVDGRYAGDAHSYGFGLDAVSFAENSVHSVSVISKDTLGKIHYCAGLCAYLAHSDIFADDSLLSYTSGVSVNNGVTGAGEIISVPVDVRTNVLALRLSATCGSGTDFFYSPDGGSTWLPITPGVDEAVTQSVNGILLKAVLDGSSKLSSWDLELVFENNPLKVSSKLIKPIETLGITAKDITEAKTALCESFKDSTVSVSQYISGVLSDSGIVFNALNYPDNTPQTAALIAVGAGNRLYAGENGRVVPLLREAVGSTAPVTRTIDSDSPIYAIRLLASDEHCAAFLCSTDGEAWSQVNENEYKLLDKAASRIYLKANVYPGCELKALHVEGITATAKELSVDLRPAVGDVKAVDWGAFYAEQSNKRYDLTWTDETAEDETAANITEYEIYRNGTLIATVSETEYSDTDYVRDAEYAVRAVRKYTGYGAHLTRCGELMPAEMTVMYAPAEVTAVNIVAEEQSQSEYLNELYGGNYTFSDEASAPEGDMALERSLLGSNKYCGYGFEPINFNTGNFILEASDTASPELDEALFALSRTYNSLSASIDGVFGAGWESPYSQHLTLYKNGDVSLNRADGSVLRFVIRSDGSYESRDAENLSLALSKDRRELILTDKDGTRTCFTGSGLLKRIESSDGRAVSIRRDSKGLITGLVLPSGDRIQINMDEQGHITQIRMPGGSTLRYAYENKRLVSYTDIGGNETRYVYDGQGRMTEWYDALGVCQVKNTYDDMGRVISQTDAKGGEYALEYFDDHTAATDALGGRSEIWFDALKRTERIVDALGGVTRYTYAGETGSIASITAPDGSTTAYDYDSRGSKIKETAPDGSSYMFAYDANGNLTATTDQLGKVTRYEYDAKNRRTAEISPDGGETRYTYDDNGKVTSVTDALGNRSRFIYKGVLLTCAIDALGNETRYAYDRDGRLISTSDALGNRTSFTYDASGNVSGVEFADGSSFSYEYDANGNLTAQTDALGNVTLCEYDAMGQLVRSTAADGSESSFVYDALGRRIQSTDANGNSTAYTYDALGNLLTETDALGNTTHYAYDAAGRLIKTVMPNGGEISYAYNPNGQLLSRTGADGESVCYTYDAKGRAVTETAPDGGTTIKSYDDMGRVICRTDPMGNETHYAYDLAGRLISETDASGNSTEYAHDALGNVTEVRDALGGVTRYTYDALGRVSTVTDALGAETKYAYDSVGNLVSATDALGGRTSYAYDKNGSITELIDALGGKSAMSYDSLGNVTEVLQKNSGRVTAEYDANGNLTAQTDALGGVTSYEYNAKGLVTAIRDALGQSAELRYDALGNISGISSPDGGGTSFDYDKNGRLIRETDALGAVTEYRYDKNGRLNETEINGNTAKLAYDKNGNVKSITDAEGRRVDFEYNALNALTAVIYPDGTRDSYEYDALGRLILTTPRKGEATSRSYNAMGDVLSTTTGDRTTGYEYDLLGRVTAVITPDGARSELRYDALGNIVTARDALGNETQYSYTADSMLNGIKYANGGKVTAKYDLNGRLISETDPEGSTTHYAYDALGRMTETTDALGAVTRYAYDAADNLTKVTDALGNASSYTYDLNGNLLTETDALGNTTSYTYTPEGWLDTVTDAEGKVTRYAYDKTGSVISADYAGEKSESHSYDALGLLTSVTTEDGVTEYRYDEASRLISVTQPNGESVSYSYDGYGNRTAMTYPDGKTARYIYDKMNRLICVEGVDGSITSYKYNALGQRISTNGEKEDTAYAYDKVGNLISQTTTGEHDIAFAYDYDLSGRITAETRTENGAVTESSYIYDALGQLTAFTKSDGYAETYAYDALGNMTEKTAGGVKTQYKYNAGNRLTESVTGAEKTKYSYDKVGNLVKKDGAGGSVSYTYNALNLLSQWTDGTHAESYTYNASGLLASITTESSTTAFVWDILNGDGQMLTSTTDGETTSYTYGLERISALTGKTRTEYVYDARGSVAAEVSYNAAWYTLGGALSDKTVTSKAYTPFGEQLGEATSGFGFNGEYYNAETGQIYLRARFYEPEMNRFSQKDIIRGSITDGLSLNRYLYCANDPVNFVDPSGMKSNFLSNVYNSAKNIVNSAVTKGKEIVNNVTTGFNNACNYVRTKAENLYNSAKTIVNNVKETVNDIREKVSSWGNGGNDNGNDYTADDIYTGGNYYGDGSGYSSDAYDANGNATSYFNSSYDQGVIPSPDAPRIADATEQEIAKCANGEKKTNTFLTQNDVEGLSIYSISHIGDMDFRSGKIDYTYLEAERNSSTTLKQGLLNAIQSIKDMYGASVSIVMSSENLPLLSVAGPIALAEPTPVGEILLGIGIVAFVVIESAKGSNNRESMDFDDVELPSIFVQPLPELRKGHIESVPKDTEDKGSNVESIPTEDEAKETNTESIPLPEEDKQQIVTAESEPESDGKRNIDCSHWNSGSFDSPEDSLEYHYDKHGEEVGAKDIEDYVNKAESFSKNLKGARSKEIDGFVDGVTRYYKNGKYIDIAPDGTIVSFGAQ